MKFPLILLIILCSLISSPSNAGGVSGGGGNLISPTAPSERQDPRDIKNIILDSHHLLHNFIDSKYSQYTKGSMDDDSHRLYSFLFADQEDNLNDALEEIRVDIKLDKPCFDKNGKVFDGSIFNDTKHSICISAFTIAQKCHKNEVPKQATALVFHEYTEAMGLSDEDAITLQKQFLDELKK